MLRRPLTSALGGIGSPAASRDRRRNLIKAIQRIKGLGVFANYTRPAGAQEFAAKNLIYH